MNKMNKILAFILTLVITEGFGQNQEVFYFFDSDNNKPVEGVFAKTYEPASNKWNYYVSDSKGRITSDAFTYPLLVWLSHINYSPVLDTITVKSPKTILLTPALIKLEEVVITGQYEPQSAENSVYHITSISRAEIVSKGAMNLEEVLNTALNVRLQKDPATGTTSIRLQGISGENIKLLIDGVPLAGRVGGQLDINQIDLNLIEKIEIVEGPMAVSYGSNAMGGVINVITKKNNADKWFIHAVLSEETVAEEYGFEQGIHNQHVSGGLNISDNVYSQMSLSHNYFGGYYGDEEGRSTRWDPKSQFLGSFLLKYSPTRFKSFYKFDYLKEKIENKGEVTGIFNPIALDEEYETNRFIHQFQLGYKVSNTSRINTLFAFTNYQRIKRQYVTNLKTGEKPLSKATGAQDTTQLNEFNFRGSYLNLASSGNISYEAGYDITLESGQGGRIIGSEKKVINDFGFFGSTEIVAGPWKIRPGLRISYNSLYHTPIIPSLNVMWRSTNFGLRFAYGRGYRAPTIKELYLEFVDSSHRIFGNDKLAPEDGHHLDFGITLTPKKSGILTYKPELGFFFNALNNKITFGQSPEDPTVTTYINIDKFKSVGGDVSVKYRLEKLFGEVGVAYTGRLSEFEDISNKSFLFSPEAVFNVSYQLSQIISLGLYYKFTGSLPRYFISETNEPELTKTDSYNWLDLTSVIKISKTFRTTLGIKNLLNVTDINAGLGGDTHSGGSSLPVSYGISGFLKLELNINGNNF